ncbi:MAG: peptide deformylase [Candidatus Kapaibacteriales bacterium]
MLVLEMLIYYEYFQKYMPSKKFLPIYNCFHPVLREKCIEVSDDTTEINSLITQMSDTMINAEGIGLAANQVGLKNRIFVIDANAGRENENKQLPIEMINPVITSSSDEEVTIQEGCLSIPFVYENVDRPEGIEVKYLDKSFKEKTLEANGLLARVIMHELDHLDGVLFIDKLTSLQKALIKNKMNKILKNKINPKYEMVDKDGNIILPEKLA